MTVSPEHRRAWWKPSPRYVRRIGPDFGSDHFPIIADLRLVIP
jgi:hypothetical protein